MTSVPGSRSRTRDFVRFPEKNRDHLAHRPAATAAASHPHQRRLCLPYFWTWRPSTDTSTEFVANWTRSDL